MAYRDCCSGVLHVGGVLVLAPILFPLIFVCVGEMHTLLRVFSTAICKIYVYSLLGVSRTDTIIAALLSLILSIEIQKTKTEKYLSQASSSVKNASRDPPIVKYREFCSRVDGHDIRDEDGGKSGVSETLCTVVRTL